MGGLKKDASRMRRGQIRKRLSALHTATLETVFAPDRGGAWIYF